MRGCERPGSFANTTAKVRCWESILRWDAFAGVSFSFPSQSKKGGLELPHPQLAQGERMNEMLRFVFCFPLSRAVRTQQSSSSESARNREMNYANNKKCASRNSRTNRFSFFPPEPERESGRVREQRPGCVRVRFRSLLRVPVLLCTKKSHYAPPAGRTATNGERRWAWPTGPFHRTGRDYRAYV